MNTSLMEASITLSVISHGHGALIAALFKDLDRLRSPAIGKVILTRNLAEPHPVPALQHYRLQVIDNPVPKGFGANHNAAFEHCDTGFYAVVNPDIRLPSDPFPALVQRLAQPGFGMAAPAVLEADGRPSDHARPLITPWSLARRYTPLARAGAAQATGTDWVAGMFLVFRSEVYRSLLGFDERYRLYCEDIDICARLRLSGHRFDVVREASVVHEARRSSHRSWRYLSWHLASLLRWWTSPAFYGYRRLLAKEAPR
jgi:N-acetylglucosaminyl-diphospho-decaprenol L-rhamnosyltransferase